MPTEDYTARELPAAMPYADRFVAITERVRARFLSKIRRTRGCWEWTGHRDSYGYGRLNIERSSVLAHRIALYLSDPAWGAQDQALHRCDNPACVRPDHLFPGTQVDNVKDMVAKGRGGTARGESNALSKLTAEQVREIRRRKAAGESLRAIAENFGVTPSAAGRAASGDTWAKLDEPPAPKRPTRGVLVGEDNPRAKLTEADVRAIRRAVGSGEPRRSVAARFAISHGSVSQIANRSSWKHVE